MEMKWTQQRNGDCIELSVRATDADYTALAGRLYDGHNSVQYDQVAVNGTRAILRLPEIALNHPCTVEESRAIDAAPVPMRNFG